MLLRTRVRSFTRVGIVSASLLGCQPTIVADPSPGYVHIVSLPPRSTSPVTIWFRDPGHNQLSTVSFDFAAAERILIVFPSTPSAPGNQALQVNDMPCDGTWAITSNVETDVLLIVEDASCRTEVLGTHTVGTVHTHPQTEPNVDPIE
jgi:hypothetical protein